MRIKLENVNAAHDTIHEMSSSRGLTLFLDYNMFNSYQNLLKEIASERKYTEGEEILPSDLERIKASVKGLIESAGNELSSKTVSRDDQATYNSFPQMIALSDYLFATAMKELGCPDIRAHFGEDIEEDLKRTAKNVNKQIKRDVLSTVDGDEHYNAQRYKDANVVRGANSELIAKCSNKSANSLELAQLTAEYQALHKRQAGHGAIWRLFHKSQNIERTELLKDMKDAIQAMVGNVEILEKTPQEISDIADDKKIEKESVNPFKEEAIVDRNGLKWTSFVYAPKNSDRANAERESVKNGELLNQENENDIEINSYVAENNGIRVPMHLKAEDIDGKKNDEIVSTATESEIKKEASVSVN
jgi:hypothetical protein